MGGFAFVAAAQEDSQQLEGLRKAAFWVHQRQDVHNAIFNQQPPKTDLRMCGIDRSMNEASEDVWAKRAACLAADVVTFCFGPEAASVETYRELRHRLDRWQTSNPPSFIPLYSSERDMSTGQFFPEICLTLDACGKSYPFTWFMDV
jgi:hypothetical protein